MDLFESWFNAIVEVCQWIFAADQSRGYEAILRVWGLGSWSGRWVGGVHVMNERRWVILLLLKLTSLTHFLYPIPHTTFWWVKNSPKKSLPHLQYVENVLPGVFSWRRWSNCKRWLEQIRIWCTRTTRRPTDYKTSCHLLIYVGFQWSLKCYRLTPSWGRFPCNSNYFFLIHCFKRNLAMNINIHVEFCWRRMFFHSPFGVPQPT